MSDKIVLVTDYTWSSEPEAQVLAEVGARLLVAKSGSEAELIQLVPQADTILTCYAHVTPQVIQAGTRLQVIGRYGIGVDIIAVDEATDRGIPVTHGPAYCLDEVSELARAFMLALARNVCRYDTAIHNVNRELKSPFLRKGVVQRVGRRLAY